MSIDNERCNNYHICRISAFLELSDCHISRGMDILKSRNYQIIQIWKLWNYLTQKLYVFLSLNVWLVCVCIYMYICIHVCKQTWVSVCMSLLGMHDYVCVYVWMYVHMLACISAYTHPWVFECMYVCIHIGINAGIHISFMHVHICLLCMHTYFHACLSTYIHNYM